MITKGTIEQILENGKVRVRIYLFDKAKNVHDATPTEELRVANISTLPGIKYTPEVGDDVFIAFEDGLPSTPTIIGYLFNDVDYVNRTTINTNTLEVNNKCVLPFNTVVRRYNNKNISNEFNLIEYIDTSINDKVDNTTDGANSLIKKLEYFNPTEDFSDNSRIITQNVLGGDTDYYLRPISSLWDKYFKYKITKQENALDKFYGQGELPYRALNYADAQGTVYLGFGSGKQNHGVYSSGYYNLGKKEYTSSAKWLIHRDENGDIILDPDTKINGYNIVTKENPISFSIEASTTHTISLYNYSRFKADIGLVYLNFQLLITFTSNVAAGANFKIGTVPAAYKPLNSVQLASDFCAGTQSGSWRCWINSAGDIYMSKSTAISEGTSYSTSDYLKASGCYFIK